jgi:hypothetical protein
MSNEEYELFNYVAAIATTNSTDVDQIAEAHKALKPLNFANEDPEMKQYKKWLLWKYELNEKGEITKIPHSRSDDVVLYEVSPTNNLNWLFFY